MGHAGSMEGTQLTNAEAAIAMGFRSLDEFNLWRTGNPEAEKRWHESFIEMKKRYRQGDGTILEHGTVLSLLRGFKEAVYRCHCGREQQAKHPDYSGGIEPDTALSIGWKQSDAGWECPFCSGYTAGLEK